MCSVFDGDHLAITCPIRFRENWIIADDGADFFFPKNAKWSSLTEVRLKDKNDKSAGNIDLVLVSYDDLGKITDFGALEVQAVYISGNVRKPFEYYMEDPKNRAAMNWKNQQYWPGPDYLSSSRKRLAPQLIFKGGILHAWKKKTAVALDQGSYDALPRLPEVSREDAEIAWLIYDFEPSLSDSNDLQLIRRRTAYTKRPDAPERPEPFEGEPEEEFLWRLEEELERLAV